MLQPIQDYTEMLFNETNKAITGNLPKPLCIVRAAVVIDPPRKGCGPEFLDQLFAFSPKRVVYVSCNQATIPIAFSKAIRLGSASDRPLKIQAKAIKLGIFVSAKEAKIAKFLYPDTSFN